jgi:hypothetical protein
VGEQKLLLAVANPELLLPEAVLRVTVAEGEYGIWQLPALAFRRTHPDQQCSVVAAFDFPGVGRQHGGRGSHRQLSGEASRGEAGVLGWLFMGGEAGLLLLPTPSDNSSPIRIRSPQKIGGLPSPAAVSSSARRQVQKSCPNRHAPEPPYGRGLPAEYGWPPCSCPRRGRHGGNPLWPPVVRNSAFDHTGCGGSDR